MKAKKVVAKKPVKKPASKKKGKQSVNIPKSLKDVVMGKRNYSLIGEDSHDYLAPIKHFLANKFTKAYLRAGSQEELNRLMILYKEITQGDDEELRDKDLRIKNILMEENES